MKKRKIDDPRARTVRRDLGRALAILRRKRGLSVREAAEGAKVSVSTFRLWERGEVEPTLERLREALLALGYDFYDLQDILDTLESTPGAQPPPEPAQTQEEILIREIVEDFARLFRIRERVERMQGES